jgi:membrane protease YdiL (CAAX protease family)
MSRLSGRPAVAVTVVSLATFDIVRRVAIPSRFHFVANVAMIGVVGGVAVWSGLSAAQLGVDRSSTRAGLRVGAIAFAGITAAICLASLVPAVRNAMVDQGSPISRGQMLWRVLIRIPVGTVLLEELAFRGVLLANLRRVTSVRRSIGWSVAAFAVWHLPGVISAGAGAGSAVASGRAGVIVTTLVSTAVAGLGFTMLREKSGSLIASSAAHVATNSVPFALAWFLVR